MPLRSSGAISISQIQTEFGGGSGAISINAFYRGGARVPNDVFCHNNTIPASGQISWSSFLATTNGLTYIEREATGNFNVPANAVRFQAEFTSAGGGGVAISSAIFGGRRNAGAAGGGGGHKTWRTGNIPSGQTQLRSVIGGGGARVIRTNYNTTAQAGAGGQTSIQTVGGSILLGPNASSGGSGGRVGTGGTATGGARGSGDGTYGGATAGTQANAANNADRFTIGGLGGGVQSKSEPGGYAGGGGYSDVLANGSRDAWPGDAGWAQLRF